MPAQEYNFGENVDLWKGLSSQVDPSSRPSRGVLCKDEFGPVYQKEARLDAIHDHGILDFGWTLFDKESNKHHSNSRGYRVYAYELRPKEQAGLIFSAINEMWTKVCAENTHPIRRWMELLVINELDSVLKKKLSDKSTPRRGREARPEMPQITKGEYDYWELRVGFHEALCRGVEKFLEQYPRAVKLSQNLQLLLIHWERDGHAKTKEEIANLLRIPKGSVTGGKQSLMKTADRIWRECHEEIWPKK